MSLSRRHTPSSIWFFVFCASLFALLAVSSVNVWSQISSDSKTSATGSGATLSWSHAIGTEANRILIVGVSIRRSNRTVSSITYGTSSLTRVGFQNSATNIARMELWYLLDPPSGNATITVTLGGSSDIVAGAVSFSGVDQTTPLGTFSSAAGTGLSGSVTTSSAPDQVVVDVAAAPGTALSLAPGGSQDLQWVSGTGTAGNNVHGGGSTTPGALSVTTTWSLGFATDWAIGAVSLKPAAYPTIVLSLAQDNSSPSPGATVTYTISYTNVGTGTAGSSLIAFSPPTNTALVINSVYLNGIRKTDAADGDEVTLSGSTITVNLGSVLAGASGTLNYSVVIQ